MAMDAKYCKCNRLRERKTREGREWLAMRESGAGDNAAMRRAMGAGVMGGILPCRRREFKMLLVIFPLFARLCWAYCVRTASFGDGASGRGAAVRVPAL